MISEREFDLNALASLRSHCPPSPNKLEFSQPFQPSNKILTSDPSMVSQSVDLGYMSKQNRSIMQKKKLRKIGKGSPNDVNLQINKIPISPLAAIVKFSNNHIN